MVIYEIIDGKQLILANPKEAGNVYDGYHTFNELYDHRCLLFIALCQQLKDKIEVGWKPHYDGWFLFYAKLPNGQISYHIPDKYLDLITGSIELREDYEWDGHKPNDVVDRLIEFVNHVE
jgi:hypothetical protein